MIREFDDLSLPTTFSQLSAGDIFDTDEVHDHRTLGYVRCLKLASNQSPNGNAVKTCGDFAGYVVQLGSSAEVELVESSRASMNSLLRELRARKKISR